MNSSEKIKKAITPTMVVQHYLGQPTKNSGINLIYKSPFRNERTASFWVNDTKGIHDFGTGIHYDIISFVQELFKIDFKTAIDKLQHDFGIIDSEQSSKELELYLIQKREDELRMKRNLDKWFNNTLSKLCDKLHEWQELIPLLKNEALAIAYAKEQYVNYLIDIFINATEDEKLELWKDKEKIENGL